MQMIFVFSTFTSKDHSIYRLIPFTCGKYDYVMPFEHFVENETGDIEQL